jgi:predicted ATPase
VRQGYHQQVAQLLEARFPEVVATQPELVAHHYTAAACLEQAIGYWQRAGHHAAQRSAMQEAVRHLTQGLALLAEVRTMMEQNGVRYVNAELHRLEGELRLRQSTPEASLSETCFQQALAVARQQQARSLELRAAMSLARLWQAQGKGQEAYDLLAPVYDWFTEGFDTADVIDAKQLVDELRPEKMPPMT